MKSGHEKVKKKKVEPEVNECTTLIIEVLLLIELQRPEQR